MAATPSTQSPADLSPAELVEYLIAQAVSNLEQAEQTLWRLDAGSAFDIGCALVGARRDLDRALAAIPQRQAQPFDMAA